MSKIKANGGVIVDQTKDVASQTLAALEMIGNTTAAQIRATADLQLEESSKLNARLHALADAIEESTNAAKAEAASFCLRATHILETVRGLQAKIPTKMIEATTIESATDAVIVE